MKKTLLTLLALTLLAGTAYQYAQAADTGFQAAGTGTESFSAWTNEANITASDDSRATCNGPTCTYILATNFGFSVPAGATIDGVEFKIEMNDGGGNFSDTPTYLVVGGAVQTGTTDQQYCDSACILGTDTVHTYPQSGGSTDTWGNSLDAADVNASDFGVAFSFSKASAGTMGVDYIEGKVYYTEAAGNPATVQIRTGSLIINGGSLKLQ